MNATLASLVFRWILGGVLVVITGAGTILAGVALAESGWHRDTFLFAIGCAWVLTGASAFLMRRDFGRQVLLGAMEAFCLFFAALAGMSGLKLGYFRLLSPATPWVAALVALLAALLWAGLRLPSVRGAMRSVGEGRRTTRCRS